MDFSEEIYCFDSDTDTYDSNCTQEDPTFDVVEETRSKFSNLSISKKAKSRGCSSNDVEESDGEEPNGIEIDDNDQKSYVSVQNMIQAGGIERLKVDQCKVYLRKHGLRLTGSKATVIERIKEHMDIVNGGGEKKYPVSSFVLNCKGDACTGDVVLFEQNVYEMFSIASRSANGPPCGTRLVAGRIVKESYGMAKQQHTFTIEVLWSKGEKPLPALHPLLIKGRNLYRLKTMRQRWENEGQRQKILSEKHAIGTVARTKRDARIEEKEMRMKLKSDRAKRTNCQKQAKNTEISSKKQGNENEAVQKINQSKCEMNVPKPFHAANMPSHQRQPLTDANVKNDSRQHLTGAHVNTSGSYTTQNPSYNTTRSTLPGTTHSENMNSNFLVFPATAWHGYAGNRYPINQTSTNSLPVLPNRYPSDQTRVNSLPVLPNRNFNHGAAPAGGQRGHEKRQPCRYYAQGRCYYGHNCKYLH